MEEGAGGFHERKMGSSSYLPYTHHTYTANLAPISVALYYLVGAHLPNLSIILWGTQNAQLADIPPTASWRDHSSSAGPMYALTSRKTSGHIESSATTKVVYNYLLHRIKAQIKKHRKAPTGNSFPSINFLLVEF